MKSENIFHDWLIDYLRKRLSKDYSEISINYDGEETNEFNGSYPDLILKNHGLVMGIMEVETTNTISPEKAAEWKKKTTLGARLILMIPESERKKAMDLLWSQGIADKAGIGSYDLKIKMP